MCAVSAKSKHTPTLSLRNSIPGNITHYKWVHVSKKDIDKNVSRGLIHLSQKINMVSPFKEIQGPAFSCSPKTSYGVLEFDIVML